MDELSEDESQWNLEKHLKGCITGFQTDPNFGAAVFFALEALWGVAKDVEVGAKSGKFGADNLDADWTIAPNTNLPVPWLWICALAEAWSRYKMDGIPLGHAFGLEGGQGKSALFQFQVDA